MDHSPIDPRLIGSHDYRAAPVSSCKYVGLQSVAARLEKLQGAAHGSAARTLEQDRQTSAHFRADYLSGRGGPAHRLRRAHRISETGVVQLRRAARVAVRHE